ncbi:hypothetical protein KTN05_09305 [Paracoccus sp. Z118]|uniref:hypothetical protein n=1 Tax=Paracoccus sp. Z118 TaxID=2851017 RepID=UPI001C2C06EA|nr:hypothetical protein [Paracoccus sp. Z118]MBV0892046.1 hypothetical protein [Paracoccus sp. Z118]
MVVAVGRRIVALAVWLTENTPNILLGVGVALALSTLLGAVPILGAVLNVFLSKLLLLIGFTAGAIEDIRMHAMKDALDRVAARFAPLKDGLAA